MANYLHFVEFKIVVCTANLRDLREITLTFCDEVNSFNEESIEPYVVLVIATKINRYNDLFCKQPKQ
jgi:hypothetical protein